MKKKARSKNKKRAEVAEMVQQYSGVFPGRPPEIITGDVECMKVILRYDDESEKVIFQGKHFSKKEFIVKKKY